MSQRTITHFFKPKDPVSPQDAPDVPLVALQGANYAGFDEPLLALD